MPPAKILSREETLLSPWVRLVRKDVEFAPGQRPETYHSLAQADYIAILARTPGGLIPIVCQYRPAVEAYTWELPAGLLEPGETPELSCRRELKEETGLDSETIIPLGAYYPDTGRHGNEQHAFFVRASDPDPSFRPEPGMSVKYVTFEILKDLIRKGEFRHQLHIAVFTLASLRGLDF